MKSFFKKIRQFVRPLVVATSVLVVASWCPADARAGGQYGTSTATAALGFTNAVPANTTNTTQWAPLTVTKWGDCSLMATGWLAAAGTSGIQVKGFPSVDGLTNHIDATANFVWNIPAAGTLTFYGVTNILSTVIGATGYEVFTTVGNGNTANLSNFFIKAYLKPSRSGD